MNLLNQLGDFRINLFVIFEEIKFIRCDLIYEFNSVLDPKKKAIDQKYGENTHENESKICHKLTDGLAQTDKAFNYNVSTE